jgi:hypothetical protein
MTDTPTPVATVSEIHLISEGTVELVQAHTYSKNDTDTRLSLIPIVDADVDSNVDVCLYVDGNLNLLSRVLCPVNVVSSKRKTVKQNWIAGSLEIPHI